LDKELEEKLSRLPGKSRKAINGFTRDLVDAFEERLYSFILFGSAASRNFIEGKSDINTIIILDDVVVSDLEVIMEIGQKYAKKGMAVPLVFEIGHVVSSLDTFPIEFSDMKQRHILLHGKDTLKDARIERKNLRYQCEREFKSMVVNLRRGYLRTDGKREKIEAVLDESLASVLAACRGMIWMAEKTPPDDISDLLRTIIEIYDTDTSGIDRVWRLHQGQSGATALLEALFEDYENNIADLAAVADGLEG
jgi:predicted nucleotidyltransferase